MTPPKKLYTKFIWLGVLCLFLGWKTLTYAGYCYTDHQFLSEQELMERYLLGKDWRSMTPSERAEKLASVKNYPECCRLSKKSMALSHSGVFMNVVFLNSRSFGIETHFQRTSVDYNEADLYYATYSDVDACGDKRDRDRFGETEDEMSYQFSLRSIKNYWQEKGHTSLEK